MSFLPLQFPPLHRSLGMALLAGLFAETARAEEPGPPTRREGLISLSLPALLGQHAPWLQGGGQLGHCSGAPQSLDVALDALQAAERAMAYLRHEEAERAFAEAEAALGCSAGPVAANIAARVPFLRGVEAALGGQAEAARAQFRSAQRIRPGLAWDPNYPPEAALPFELARADVATEPMVGLRLVPAPLDAWVDGRPIADPGQTLLLGPGRHYVQIPAQGWPPLVLELPPQATQPPEGTPSTLYLPALVRPDTLSWLSEAQRPKELEGLLRGVAAPGTPLVVDLGGKTFAGAVGETAWEPVRLEPPRPGRVWRAAAWSGAVLTLDGAAMALLGQAGMRKSAAAAEKSETLIAYREEQGAFDAWSGLTVAGMWVMGGGIVLSGGGIAGLEMQGP